jgi:hypothetical protein
VDYKSTAQLSNSPKPLNRSFLDDPWKAGYKRQAEMYQWILRRKGFDVSDIAYFVYVDGQHIGINGMLSESPPFEAQMTFKTAIIEYVGSDSWVERALFEAKDILQRGTCPAHREKCDVGRFLNQASLAAPVTTLENL